MTNICSRMSIYNEWNGDKNKSKELKPQLDNDGIFELMGIRDNTHLAFLTLFLDKVYKLK